MLVSGADLDFVVAFGLDFFGGFVCSLFFLNYLTNQNKNFPNEHWKMTQICIQGVRFPKREWKYLHIQTSTNKT